MIFLFLRVGYVFVGGYCAKSPARPPLQHLSNFEHRPLRQTQEHYASGDAEHRIGWENGKRWNLRWMLSDMQHESWKKTLFFQIKTFVKGRGNKWEKKINEYFWLFPHQDSTQKYPKKRLNLHHFTGSKLHHFKGSLDWPHGWNLNIIWLNSGKSSEPNLNSHFNDFQGCTENPEEKTWSRWIVFLFHPMDS